MTKRNCYSIERKIRDNFFRLIPVKIKRLCQSVFSKSKTKYLTWRMNELYKNGEPRPSPKKILFWSTGGMPPITTIDSAIAAALKLRGCSVHAIICDGTYSACTLRVIYESPNILEWKKRCAQCKVNCQTVLEKMQIPYSHIGDYLTQSEIENIKKLAESSNKDCLDNYSYNNIIVGKNIRSSVIRYLQGYPLKGLEAIVPEYTISGLICAAAASKACDKFSPDHIFMSHGIYVDWGPALQIAINRQIPTTGWISALNLGSWYIHNIGFDYKNFDFHNIRDSSWDTIKNTEFTLLENKRLENFFKNRYVDRKCNDTTLLAKYSDNLDDFKKQYGLIDQKPVWGIFAHVNWDGVADFSPMLFNDFEDWIYQTILTINKLPEIDWLIKIHPFETYSGRPVKGIHQFINDNFPELPTHIHIIPSHEIINPLDFYNVIDGGVTTYGTAGLELAYLGKPVILAGSAYYGNKGFTYDAHSIPEYHTLLKRAVTIEPLANDIQLLAKKFAYCHFIRRQMPFDFINKNTCEFSFEKRSLLLPRKDPFVDFICENILTDGDFIMDENLIQLLFPE